MLAEKFIGWPKYSHGIRPNEVYFSTVPLVDYTLLLLVLQCLDIIGKKILQQEIWYHHMNFSAYSYTYISKIIYMILIKIYTIKCNIKHMKQLISLYIKCFYGQRLNNQLFALLDKYEKFYSVFVFEKCCMSLLYI